jgi:hypothetical protein
VRISFSVPPHLGQFNDSQPAKTQTAKDNTNAASPSGISTKTSKDSDMKIVLRKQLKRKIQGKETEALVNGRPVSAQKISRFMRRKALTPREILEYDTSE